MKKNVVFRIAAIVLMCTLVTACFASSTFAKYTSSTAANTNTATVAKWDITYNGQQIATKTPATVTFNVFDTILDTATGAKDTDVSDDLIAPGTKGSFTVADIVNDSEVTAKIGVKIISVSNTKNIPIKFYSDEAMTQDITDKIVADKYIVGNAALDDGATVAKEGGTLTGTTVYWQWVFEGDRDEADTGLGIDAQTTAPTYTITLQLVAEQVD